MGEGGANLGAAHAVERNTPRRHFAEIAVDVVVSRFLRAGRSCPSVASSGVPADTRAFAYMRTCTRTHACAHAGMHARTWTTAWEASC